MDIGVGEAAGGPVFVHAMFSLTRLEVRVELSAPRIRGGDLTPYSSSPARGQMRPRVVVTRGSPPVRNKHDAQSAGTGGCQDLAHVIEETSSRSGHAIAMVEGSLRLAR